MFQNDPECHMYSIVPLTHRSLGGTRFAGRPGQACALGVSREEFQQLGGLGAALTAVALSPSGA
jgi:hypothetical protein